MHIWNEVCTWHNNKCSSCNGKSTSFHENEHNKSGLVFNTPCSLYRWSKVIMCHFWFEKQNYHIPCFVLLLVLSNTGFVTFVFMSFLSCIRSIATDFTLLSFMFCFYTTVRLEGRVKHSPKTVTQSQFVCACHMSGTCSSIAFVVLSL